MGDFTVISQYLIYSLWRPPSHSQVLRDQLLYSRQGQDHLVLACAWLPSPSLYHHSAWLFRPSSHSSLSFFPNLNFSTLTFSITFVESVVNSFTLSLLRAASQVCCVFLLGTKCLFIHCIDISTHMYLSRDQSGKTFLTLQLNMYRCFYFFSSLQCSDYLLYERCIIHSNV